MEPDLRAVLFLDGPAELQVHVADVAQKEVSFPYLLWWGQQVRYRLRPSLLGPEGWEAVQIVPWKKS